MRQKIIKVLGNDKAKLGLASALIQAANLLVLLLAKPAVTDEGFAFLLTNLAFAGIIGSIASMRLEVLVFQEHGKMSYAALLMPIAAMSLVIGLSFAGYMVASAAGLSALKLSPMAAAMMVGLGLSTILSFVFVQEKRMSLLLAMRAAQAAGLAGLMAAIATGWGELNGPFVLLFIGISYGVPAVLWLVYFLLRLRPETDDVPVIYAPKFAMMKRSGLLTISTGVNSVYVNFPLLAAAATQSAGFVADFGLILRMFTAPITLIFQVIGRLFLADAIRWSVIPDRANAALSRLISKAMVQSVGLYLIVAPILIGVLYIFRDPLNLTHLHIAPFLFLAALGQCAINPVSQVRMALSDERAFLIWDALRLAGLAFGLYIVAQFIPFEMAFGAAAVILYTGYIVFIRWRVASHKPS